MAFIDDRRVQRLPVEDASQVADARAAAVTVARFAGLSTARADVVALVATELAENLHRHAVGGELLLLRGDAAAHVQPTLSVISVDRGPGVERFERCLIDGYSTRGTFGTGLGAVVRLADKVDAVSELGRGTVVRADFGSADPGAATGAGARPGGGPDRWAHFDVGAIGFPIDSEIVNGDGWAIARPGGRIVVLLADGLGHGPDAAAASAAAVAQLAAVADEPPESILRTVNYRIAGTRGAAVTITSLDLDSARDGGSVHSAGLGNVSLLIAAPSGSTHRIATSHGTAGARRDVRIGEMRNDFPAGGVLIMHTDGLTSRWHLDGRAELLRHSATTIAAALWRDFARATDDSYVVVVKRAADDPA